MIRPSFAVGFAALAITVGALSACSQGGAKSGAATDPYAGLDSQIVEWRNSIEASHPACKAKVEGKGCTDFQVMCKAAQVVTPQETAKGVTAKIVAAMTFAGRNADGSTGKSGSSFSYFTKTGDAWARTSSPPVNMSTCAPL